MNRIGDQTMPLGGGWIFGDGTYSSAARIWQDNPETYFNGNSWATWPAANMAKFTACVITHPVNITAIMFINGGAASGNIDVGIYDLAGTKIVSSGSTVMAGTGGGWTVTSVSSTLLVPGMYYLALAIDNTTASVTMRGWNQVASDFLLYRQMASAFALPATATYASNSNSKTPLIFCRGLPA